jgi:polyhydroxybutyrate depolymerase
VPILHIHSETDPRAHYAGGAGPYNFATAGRIVHEPVEATLKARALRYGCAFPPRQYAPLLGRGEEASHSAVRIAYSGCREGAELVLFRLKGPGHVWPGGRGGALRHQAGAETSVIDANDEIWRFFSRHNLP